MKATVQCSVRWETGPGCRLPVRRLAPIFRPSLAVFEMLCHAGGVRTGAPFAERTRNSDYLAIFHFFCEITPTLAFRFSIQRHNVQKPATTTEKRSHSIAVFHFASTLAAISH